MCNERCLIGGVGYRIKIWLAPLYFDRLKNAECLIYVKKELIVITYGRNWSVKIRFLYFRYEETTTKEHNYGS